VRTPQFAKLKSKRKPHHATRCLLLATAALLLPSAGAAAEQFPVTETADSGEGSLRAAIEAANANAGPDSIPISATGTIDLESVLPVISDDVEISGPGQAALTVRRDAPADFRIFESGPVALTLSGMTVANGRSNEGAGILGQGPLMLTEVTVTGNEAVASGGVEANALGGGILSFGALTMRQTTVGGNTVMASEGALRSSARAGGVAAFGGSLIDRSTVSGNTAEADGAGVSEFVVAEGAGLVLGGGRFNRVQRSTVSGNSATGSGGTAGTAAFGGGLEATNLIVTSSTITGNLADPAAGGAANLEVAEETLVRNTIVSDPLGGAPSCNQALLSEGFNIDDGSSCGFTESTDRSGTDPGLDPDLAANGGPTLTHALLPGSVAIDAGSAFGANTDQRGMPRPSDFATIANPAGGDGSDVGAFEVQATAQSQAPEVQATVQSQAPTADTTPPETRIDREPPRQTRKRLARISFSSTEPGSRFECKLDARPFKACETPLRWKVRRGARHVFRVRAIDLAGNVDQTPAKCAWRVKRLNRAHPRAQ
jgi:hypothetical protein